MRKKDGLIRTPADSAWDMFEKTGNVSYYLLYKQLVERD